MAEFNQIIGTSYSDEVTLTPASDIVLTSGGDDLLHTQFDSTDYIIAGDGVDTLSISGTSTDFTLASFEIIENAYLLTNGAFNNVIKSVELFQFSDRTLTLEEMISGDVDDRTPVTLDGMGEIDSPASFDASSVEYLFTDDSQVANNVIISGIDAEDRIHLVDDDIYIRSISNDGEDVNIIYNNSDAQNVNVSRITLAGVVSSGDIIYDEATLEAVMGFDLLA